VFSGDTADCAGRTLTTILILGFDRSSPHHVIGSRCCFAAKFLEFWQGFQPLLQPKAFFSSLAQLLVAMTRGFTLRIYWVRSLLFALSAIFQSPVSDGFLSLVTLACRFLHTSGDFGVSSVPETFRCSLL